MVAIEPKMIFIAIWQTIGYFIEGLTGFGGTVFSSAINAQVLGAAGCKILCKRFSTKSRMALESRADSGLNPLITESHGGQNGMRAGTA